MCNQAAKVCVQWLGLRTKISAKAMREQACLWRLETERLLFSESRVGTKTSSKCPSPQMCLHRVRVCSWVFCECGSMPLSPLPFVFSRCALRGDVSYYANVLIYRDWVLTTMVALHSSHATHHPRVAWHAASYRNTHTHTYSYTYTHTYTHTHSPGELQSYNPFNHTDVLPDNHTNRPLSDHLRPNNHANNHTDVHSNCRPK